MDFFRMVAENLSEANMSRGEMLWSVGFYESNVWTEYSSWLTISVLSPKYLPELCNWLCGGTVVNETHDLSCSDREKWQILLVLGFVELESSKITGLEDFSFEVDDYSLSKNNEKMCTFRSKVPERVKSV